MEVERVGQILDRIRQVKVAVYGDFCLDAYWILDRRGSEVSVETNLQAQAVGRQYYSLGGASNIVANLAALEPAEIRVVGAVGDEIFGRELRRQLDELQVDTRGLVVQKEHFDTVTFGKRYLEDREEPRIDFGFFNERSDATDGVILELLGDALRWADVVVFNQQVPGSLGNEGFVEGVDGLFDEFADRIVLFDSRHYSDRFTDVYRKTNDVEAALLNGVSLGPGDVVALGDVKRYAEKLFWQSGKPVFVTRGERGMVVADGGGVSEVPGIQLLKKLDTVGAGDTVMSALGLCLGAGVSPIEAAQFANIAAAVTVQKLFQTGTASAGEILELTGDCDYIYQPELADDERLARYRADSEIELCCDAEQLCLGRIKHAVFDHDGTISTVRQGWETIMEPVMVRAILGDKYASADETLYHQVVQRVREYIDKSTGIQTILQMEALVEMVEQAGVVPAEQLLDKFGYKQIYNDALMEMVSRRLGKLSRGELDLADYTVKGAVDFARALKKRRVRLYLASGTDHDDVVAEAGALGYDDLFDGGIYGAVGDVSKYSKKMVIERIMLENDLSGPELVCFGDGPVEVRECRKRSGVAIGVASDEVRRHGLNRDKRSRLVRAGAHIIVPDFSQGGELEGLLFGG